MARNSLRNLTSSAPATGGAPHSSAQDPKLDTTQLPADIRQLLSERETLQSKMSTLTGQQANSAETRFPITSLSERRSDDAAWAAARDRNNTGASALNEPDGSRAIPLTDQLTIPEPPARSGQRALNLLAERTGLRNLPEPQLRPPAVRELTSVSKINPLERLLGRRETTTKPERDDVLTRAAQRLDIIRGGSGDLDKLRILALERRTARQQEESALQRKRKQLDPDSNRDNTRDAARLDSSPAPARRNNDV